MNSAEELKAELRKAKGFYVVKNGAINLDSVKGYKIKATSWLMEVNTERGHHKRVT